MRYLFFLLAVLVLSGNLQAYNVQDIPGPLKENADAVVRLDRSEFNILGVGSAILKVTYVVTVLNEKGEEAASFSQSYDKDRVILGLLGTIYNPAGGVIKRLSTKDFFDQALITGLASFGDSRGKFYSPSAITYPYTIEYSYSLKFTGLLQFPSWTPATEPNVSVERSEYVVRAPIDYELRYRAFNYKDEPAVSVEDDKKIWTWRMDMVRTAKEEPFAPPFTEFNPVVYTAPGAFEYGKVPGKMDSWQTFGEWSQGLIADRNVLTPETVAEVQALVSGMTDPVEKARKVYEYMQRRTRYVSIQFGIGGFQPFPATETHAVGYGDCKALTIYTQALMAAVGIPAYYTLIFAGSDERNRTIPDFPASSFNHVFLCLPIAGDTLFAECTSQQVPFGHLGDFTCDRYALMITDQGGKLIHTPKYTEQDNLRVSKSEVKLAPDGNATALITLNFSGLDYDNRLSTWLRSPEEQRKALIKNLNIGKFELGDISFHENRGIPASLTENIAVTLPRYSALTGSRMFLTLNLENKITSPLPAAPDRKTEVFLEDGFTEIDTVQYQLPEGFTLEAKPEAIILESRFGTYEAMVSVDGTVATYTRHLVMHAGRNPAETYPELLGFYASMMKADRMSLVLVRKP